MCGELVVDETLKTLIRLNSDDFYSRSSFNELVLTFNIDKFDINTGIIVCSIQFNLLVSSKY